MSNRFDIRELRWRLKQHLPQSRTVLRKQGVGDVDALVRGLSPKARGRYRELRESYEIADWARLCSDREYVENLYVLDLLDRHLPPAPLGGTGLDIGCRNFSHLPALASFMPGAWSGVELDANARYWSGHTRRAFGEWMARQREACHYIAGSLLEVRGQFDVVVWILPFVLPGALRQWGLPQRFFQPLELLQHAFSLLKTTGMMLVVNQGEAERDEQARLFDAAGIKAQALDEMHSPFSPFRQTRFGWRVRGSWDRTGEPD